MNSSKYVTIQDGCALGDQTIDEIDTSTCISEIINEANNALYGDLNSTGQENKGTDVLDQSTSLKTTNHTKSNALDTTVERPANIVKSSPVASKQTMGDNDQQSNAAKRSEPTKITN